MLTHGTRGGRLERCLACGGGAIPACLSCNGRRIIRLDYATLCTDCNAETLCPCAFDLPLNDDPDNDPVPA